MDYRKTNHYFCLLLFLAVSFLFFSFFSVKNVDAATVTWDGSASTDWATGANWDTNSAPISTDDVVINGSYTNPPTLSVTAGSVTINSLSIGASANSTTTLSYATSTKKLIITGNLTIGANGVLTHSDNSTAEIHALWVDVGGDFTIVAGGKIDVDGKGYDAGYGMGTGSGRSGGAYGGIGGKDWQGVGGGVTYGSFTAPVNLGSGSGTGGNDNRPGGGVIIISVTGALTVNGVISANGEDHPLSNYGGSGSGGSVNITAGSISGSGTVKATGGSGYNNAGGGGGGRVSVKLTSSADFGSITMQAFGGTVTGGSSPGAAGTVYKETQAQAGGQGTLIIDNNNNAYATGTTTAIPSGQTWNVYHLVLQNKGVLEIGTGQTLDLKNDDVTSDADNNADGIRLNGGALTLSAGTLTIKDWSLIVDTATSLTGNVMIQSGGNMTHSDNSTAETYKLDLTINGNLTVDIGGTINVNTLGYDYGYGAGKGTAGSRSGGGYGGQGGAGHPGSAGGATYGSVTAPGNIGSGSGDGGYNPAGTSGGGAIILTVTGSSILNGTISANGQDYSGSYGGGGSGGSVYFTTGSLSGNGTITGTGGLGSNDGGGGGGGRTAVILTTGGADFLGFAGSITAYGGTGDWDKGAAGTVYKKTASQSYGDLIIDNNNLTTAAGVVTSISSLVTDVTFGTVTLSNKGNLTIESGQTLTVQSTGTTLTNNANSTFVNNGTLNLSGATLTNSGTVTMSATSTTNYLGQTDDTAVTILNATYGDLAFNNTGTTFTLPANLTASSTALTAGTLNLVGYNLTATSSVFTVASSTTLKLTGDNASVTSPTLATGSTVEYSATSGTRDIKNWTYTGATLRINGSGGTFTLSANLSVKGLDIDNGTLTQSSTYTIDISDANYDQSGGIFNAGTGTVTNTGILTLSGGTLNASSGQITSAGTFTVSGGTFTGSTGALDLNGDLTITSGTFTAPSGTFTLAGNLSNASTFTPGLNTITFDKSSGTQTLNPGSSSFYNLTHSGAGTLELNTNNLTVTNNFTNSSGTFDLNDLTLTVNGNTILSNGTFKTGTNTMTFGNASSDTVTMSNDAILQIESDNLTNDFIKTATWTNSSGTVVFMPATGITDALPSSLSPYHNLTVSSTNSTFTFNGNIDVNNNLVITAGTLDTDNTNNYQLNIGGEITNNSTLNLNNNTTIFDKASGTQNLNPNITFYNLTHSGAGTLKLNTNNLIVNNNFTNSSGTYNANGLTTTITGLATLSGGEYQGSTNTQTFNNGLTLNGGDFTGSTGKVDINGSLAIGASDTFTAPANILTLSNNLTNNGTFTHNNGQVNLDTTNTANITGDNTFYNLNMETPAKTITVTGNSTQTINHNLIIRGGDANASQRITLASTDANPFYLDAQNANVEVSQANVSGSHSIVKIITAYSSNNGDGNDNWVFYATSAGPTGQGSRTRVADNSQYFVNQPADNTNNTTDNTDSDSNTDTVLNSDDNPNQNPNDPSSPPQATDGQSQNPITPTQNENQTALLPAHILFTRNLKLLNTGTDVKELQRFLNHNNFVLAPTGPGSPGHETTMFGSLTKQALLKFQIARQTNTNEFPTGQLTLNTRNFINSFKTDLSSSLQAIDEQDQIPNQIFSFSFTKYLAFGQIGEEVRNLQKALSTLPSIYPEQIISGYFGQKTLNAVKRFQIQYQIVTSPETDPGYGAVGPKTREKLNEMF